MAEQGAEMRRFPRYGASLDVTVYLGSGTARARIVQISRGGCLLYPPLESQENPEVRLSFRVADDLPDIHCKGEIVYSIRDRGTGIAFSEISQYHQDLITQYFDRALATRNSDDTKPPNG